MRDTEHHEIFEVIADPALYGKEQISLSYRIHTKLDPEEAAKLLSFIRTHYSSAYDQVLEGVFSAYKRNPKWDVWIDEAKTFSRLRFTQKGELHAYIGLPVVDLALYNGKRLWGLTFPGGTNKLSFEHGFCAVFEQEKLLVLADNDFPLILQWLDYYCTDGNMLTISEER